MKMTVAMTVSDRLVTIIEPLNQEDLVADAEQQLASEPKRAAFKFVLCFFGFP